MRNRRTAITSASSHPTHGRTLFTRDQIVLVGIPFPLALTRPQLVQDLLQAAQHRDLALGIVQLKPFDAGFEPVQPLQASGVFCRSLALRP